MFSSEVTTTMIEGSQKSSYREDTTNGRDQLGIDVDATWGENMESMVVCDSRTEGHADSEARQLASR